MPHLIGPDFIGIQAADLDAARAFYTEVVGLTASPNGPPDAVVFDTRPIPFAVRAPLVDLDAVDALGQRAKPIRTACTRLDLSQAEFARRFHVPLGTLRDWEQARTTAPDFAVAYVRTIMRDPDMVAAAVA